MKTKYFPLFIFLLLVGHITHLYSQMETVKNVDLSRYAGIWYEIARLPNSFEKGLVGVTATYTLRSDGKITVLNQGFKGTLDGKRRRVKGIAKVPDPLQPGRLKVSFFLWFFADYLILDLDTLNYQYALVGSSNTDYLWVLSRTPQMDDKAYHMLLTRARDLGFTVEKLEKITQVQ
jgi:apolipoprotein D and lipocalin family protein